MRMGNGASAPLCPSARRPLPRRLLRPWLFLTKCTTFRKRDHRTICTKEKTGTSVAYNNCNGFFIKDADASVTQHSATTNSLQWWWRCKRVRKRHRIILIIHKLHPNVLHRVPKSEPPKHFATATANLHRLKWNFTYTRRHLFLSSTTNFIRILYSVYEIFNSFKLLS